MKKKLKLGLSLTLLVGLLAPSSVFAQSSYEDLLNAPENGSAVFVESEPSEITPFAAYGKIYYTADYEVTTNYRIPRDIVVPSSTLNSIRISSSATPNTNPSTKNYKVVLDEFSSWSGGYIEVQSVTIPVNVSRYEYFENLKTNTEYRLKIVGNVKGTITAYEQTR